MKLRDSFISLSHISNELNIPIASIQLTPTDGKGSKIIPSDYERQTTSTSASPEPVIPENVKIIDKQTKTGGIRVRNLKKSMLNDNKLIKLRNKFLKRSKSSAGICPRKLDADGKDGSVSKEECQNKENELPKSTHQDAETVPVKVVSPNRNRVKMGTRVFSSQFLNKSFDNIYDNAMDVYRMDDIADDHHSFSYARQNRQNQFDKCDANANGHSSSERETAEDGLSLKSTSLSSLYFSEKMSEKFSESPLPSEAYVIRKYSTLCMQLLTLLFIAYGLSTQLTL